jgi:hypothetical protein
LSGGAGGYGRGWRRSAPGPGAGWHPGPYQEADPERARKALQDQAEAFEEELGVIRKRLADMESAQAAL